MIEVQRTIITTTMEKRGKHEEKEKDKGKDKGKVKEKKEERDVVAAA